MEDLAAKLKRIGNPSQAILRGRLLGEEGRRKSEAFVDFLLLGEEHDSKKK